MTSLQEERIHLCRVGNEDALAAELAVELPGSLVRQLCPGALAVEVPPAVASSTCVLAFSQQCIPAVSWHCAASVNAWAQLLDDQWTPFLEAHPLAWTAHLVRAAWPQSPVGPRRLELVEQAWRQLLRKRHRQVLHRGEAMPAALATDSLLCQLVMVQPDHGALSAVCVRDVPHLQAVLSAYPAGHVEVPRDLAPPSRAHQKLTEALALAGLAFVPGQTVVDLGASPGGWTHVAAHAGARVTAVDRSPLAPPLMAHRDVTFVQADAFRFEPDGPVDWLICDVIAFPEKTLGLLERWLSQRWCRQFCVTVKFKGADGYGVLQPLKELLHRHAAGFMLRQLQHNKNEVTAAGQVRAP